MHSSSFPGGRHWTALTARLLDPSKKIDYLIAFLFAGGPVLLAAWVGNNLDHTWQGKDFTGYWHRPNWWSHAFNLPIALFVFRWAMARIAPVTSPDPPRELPGAVELVRSDEGRRVAYSALRDHILWPGNAALAALLIAIFSIVDAGDVLRVYLDPSVTPREADWTWVWVTGAVGKWANFAHFAYAYLVQFAILSLLVLFLVLMIRHNIFFLTRVYQRRRVPPSQSENYIVIDLDDSDHCFGFRRADSAFNAQVTCLWIAGVGLMLSRLFNVGDESKLAAYAALHSLFSFLEPADHVDPVGGPLFPDFGQWVIVLAWLAGLAIISMPALVKFLPRMPFTRAGREQATLTGYLREFLPDSYWPFSEEPTGPEIDSLAAHFARNAFWPTGNSRARALFTAAFFWGLVLVFPVWPRTGHMREFAVAYLIMFVFANIASWLAFKLLESRLVVVDPRLVKVPPGGTVQPAVTAQSSAGEAGGGDLLFGDRFDGHVFISYRRDDSVAWAGRLRDTLGRFCYPERIFRDLEGIPPGKDFVDAIDEALTLVDISIVLIGPRWLNAAHDSGGRRLDDPDDWVRVEIARALERDDVLVVPALVGGACMPAAEELPDPLQPLARRNAIEISDSRWDYDVGRLMDAMRSAFTELRRP
jgi:TIR domain